MPEFLRLDIVDILDIILVGLLIYQFYKIIRGTAAVSIFIGILLFYFIWLVVKAFHMELLTSILDKVISVGVLALIVVFQQEIRRFLLRLGTRYTKSGRGRIFFNRFSRPDRTICRGNCWKSLPMPAAGWQKGKQVR
jgi:DNA integrity scanning protein DisA with diadenylate cyclase activity